MKTSMIVVTALISGSCSLFAQVNVRVETGVTGAAGAAAAVRNLNTPNLNMPNLNTPKPEHAQPERSAFRSCRSGRAQIEDGNGRFSARKHHA